MPHNIYSIEYKLQAVKDYRAGYLSMRNFSKSIDVNFNTFASWVRKVNHLEKTSSSKLIDVKDQVVSITQYEKTSEEESHRTFRAAIKGVELVFDLKDLKTVIRELKND